MIYETSPNPNTNNSNKNFNNSGNIPDNSSDNFNEIGPNHVTDTQNQSLGPKQVEGMLNQSLGLDRLSGLATPLDKELARIAGIGIGRVAEGMFSADLNVKANAKRAALKLLEIPFQPTGFETPASTEDSVDKFTDTIFSPEEIRLGLTQIAVNLPGQTGESIREEFTILPRQPDADQEEKPSVFNEEEAAVAGTMIQVGMNVAKATEQNRKLIKPNTIWSEKTIASIEQSVTQKGLIKGDTAHIKSVIERTIAKFYPALQESIKANEAALRKIRRDAERA